MGHLTVSIIGLSLHLPAGPDKNPLPPDVAHRIVMLHTNPELDPRYPADWHDLPAHHAFIHFPTAPADRWGLGSFLTLDGYSVRLLNGTGPFHYDPTVRPTQSEFFDVPSLTQWQDNMDLKPELLEAGPPKPVAAAFFDIEHGAITASALPLGAVYTVWEVDTEGDPVLRLTHRNGSWLDIVVPGKLTGTGFDYVPGQLLFGNTAVHETDTEDDFVLYYLASKQGFPLSDVGLPKPVTGAAMRPKPEKPPSGLYPIRDMVAALTTSCSNSQYP